MHGRANDAQKADDNLSKDFLLILSYIMELRALVVPESKRFAVRYDPAARQLKVWLTSKPEKGRANLELVRELSRVFEADVRILRGRDSRKKLLLVSLDEEEIARRADPSRQAEDA